MIRFRAILSLILLLSFSQSFATIGSWKTYTSKREVRAIAGRENVLWLATSGGAVSFHFSDSTYQEFTTSEGLRTISLTAVAIENNGSVFFGSSNGILHRYYPGAKMWKYDYSLSETQSANPTINRLQVLGDTLLISSEIGVSIYSISRNEFGDTYQNFGFGATQMSGKAHDVLYTAGKIFVASEDGIAMANANSINLKDPGAWDVFTVSDGLGSNNVYALTVINDTVVAATGNGICYFNGALWQTVVGTPGTAYRDFLQQGSQRYITTQQAITEMLSVNSLVPVYSFPAYSATSVATLENGFAIGTTNNGFLLNDNGTWKGHYPVGPSSNHFLQLSADNNGILWTSTTYDQGSEGFQRFNGKEWKTVNYLPTASSYKVNIGPHNSVWMNSWGAGIAVGGSDGGLDTTFNETRGLPETMNHQANCSPFPSPFCISIGAVTDRYDTTWVAARTPYFGGTIGASILTGFYHNTIVRRVDLLDNLCHKFTDVTIDINGTIWFSNTNFNETALAQDNNLYFYNPKRRLSGTNSDGWGTVIPSDGLLSPSIYCVTTDLNGDVWVGTDIGINIIFNALDPKHNVAAYTPLRDIKVTSIAVDPLNNKWVATPQGIYYLSSDGLTPLATYSFESTDGKLVANDVLSVAVDGKNGIVYFGTTNGLSSLKIPAVTSKQSLGNITFAPNPFLIPAGTPVQINCLVSNSVVKILSIDGELIRQLEANTSFNPGAGVAQWDGKDTKGNIAASGVYFVIVSDDQGNNAAVGKLAVIRK